MFLYHRFVRGKQPFNLLFADIIGNLYKILLADSKFFNHQIERRELFVVEVSVILQKFFFCSINLIPCNDL